jgi:heptose I phosphotransferase
MQPLAVARCREGACGLTLGLKDFVRASELYPQLKDTPRRRRELVAKAAALAAAMHGAGMAHQDFYLVHIFVMPGDSLALIDLQRMIRKRKLARRWVVKDLGQLSFSARLALQPGDAALFLRRYAKLRKLGLAEFEALRSEAAAKAAAIVRHDAKRAAAKV